MNFILRHFILTGICSILILGIAGCSPNQSDQATNSRPACVTLDNYSYYIEQAMSTKPDWKLSEQTNDGNLYQWSIDDEDGKSTLSASLTSEGCICSANASSHFRMGGGYEERVGMFQVFAVAPLSNLDYTANWLEPKIIYSCGKAFLFRKPYETESLMKDETTWVLACYRSSGCEAYNSHYSLTITAPGCNNTYKQGADVVTDLCSVN